MSDPITAACERHFEKHKSDCSGFVKAVAAELGRPFPDWMRADDIALAVRKPPWKVLGPDAEASAARLAAEGRFVIAAMTSTELGKKNGHVAVVTAGEMVHSGGAAKKVPRGWWGQLNGVGKKGDGLNHSFAVGHHKAGAVIYAAAPAAAAGPGRPIGDIGLA